MDAYRALAVVPKQESAITNAKEASELTLVTAPSHSNRMDKLLAKVTKAAKAGNRSIRVWCTSSEHKFLVYPTLYPESESEFQEELVVREFRLRAGWWLPGLYTMQVIW